MVFNGEGCATIRSFIIHLHRISGEKNYDEEGKEMKKEKNGGKKCSSDLAGFELSAVGS